MADKSLMKRHPKDGYKFIYRYYDDCGSYIGQTKQCLQKRAGKNGCNYCTVSTKWSSAIKEKGFEHFNVEIITECICTDADKLEKFYIKQFDSITHGYNTSPGGKYARFKHIKYVDSDEMNQLLKKIKGTFFTAYGPKPNNVPFSRFIAWIEDGKVEFKLTVKIKEPCTYILKKDKVHFNIKSFKIKKNFGRKII